MTRQLPEMVLADLAALRAALIDFDQELTVEERLTRTVNAMSAWAKLPPPAVRHCRETLRQSIFELVADIEDDESLSERERAVLELSVWDATLALDVVACQSPSLAFVVSRKEKLAQFLSKAATEAIDRLLFSWARLLTKLNGHVHQLPGPFADDVAGVVEALGKLGVPRRAKRIAEKFRSATPALIQFAVDNRPAYEEEDRLEKTLPKLLRPPLPVPLSAVRAARVLHQVLEPAPEKMPMVVGSKGVISIRGVTYGAV